MDGDLRFCTPHELRLALGRAGAPLILDVRKAPAYAAAAVVVPGARWRDPAAVGEWAPGLPPAAALVVYCAHGEEVSQGVAAALRRHGCRARHLAGGIAAWEESGAPTLAKSALDGAPQRGPTLWVTRARPKIDRLACPWLIRRFVDREAEIRYVAPERVLAVAAESGAIPFDIPGVAFSHVGEECTFDACLAAFGLDDPGLDRLARIVRGADTSCLGLTAQSAGLFAVSLGLSALLADDQALLAQGLVLYDALYLWCRDLQAEAHAWPPQMGAAPA